MTLIFQQTLSSICFELAGMNCLLRRESLSQLAFWKALLFIFIEKIRLYERKENRERRKSEDDECDKKDDEKHFYKKQTKDNEL